MCLLPCSYRSVVQSVRHSGPVYKVQNRSSYNCQIWWKYSPWRVQLTAPESDRKVSVQGHTDPLNFRVGDALLLKEVCKMLTASLMVWQWDFPEEAMQKNLRFRFLKCVNGAWLLMNSQNLGNNTLWQTDPQEGRISWSPFRRRSSCIISQKAHSLTICQIRDAPKNP